MYSYKGKTALITGASSGIGAVFARELAARGMNLVLVARTEGKLRELADELAKKHIIKTEVIAADLGQPNVAQTLYAETQRRQLVIDMLVNNAGFSTYGEFETIAPEKEQQEVAVNVATLVDLTHAFVPSMLTRREGAIINVASTAAFVPIPRQAVYAATKAFVLSFSEALAAEYRGRGVRVFALCPGATITGFFDEINVHNPSGAQTAEQVVAEGLKAFERGRHFAVTGFNNKVQVILPRFFPRALVLRIADNVSKNMMKPRTSNSKVAAK